MKQRNDATFSFERATEFGYASVIPGLEFALDSIQKTIDDVRARLAGAQGKEPPRKLGRPPKVVTTMREAMKQSGWSADPEERSVEMARRMAVAKAKRAVSATHPDHPDHDKWKAKMSRMRKKIWNEMTPAQRKARLDAMLRGRGLKPKPAKRPRAVQAQPVVKLAAVS